MVKCEIEECETMAKYGIKQEFATRCKKHTDEDMVYRSRGYCSHEKPHDKCEDCKNDLICGVDGCEDKSTYGMKQSFPTRCKIKEHREEEMVLRPRKYCYHNKSRNQCKECDGSSICDHGRRRDQCKDCNGSSYCDHGRLRNQCKDCDGSSICSHKIQYNQCSTCRPESNHFCIGRYPNGDRCTTEKTKNSKYDNYCTICFVKLFPNDPRSKTAHLPNKQLNVRRYINIEFPDMFIYEKQLIIADEEKECTTFNRRIDFQTEFDNCILIIEVDENQHKYYDVKDEELRIMQIYQNAGKNLIIIRFNPDKYKINGKIKKTKMSKRYQVLKDTINEIINKIKNGYKFDNWLTEIKLFFDDESKIKPDTSIYCSGISKKAQRRCKNKVGKEGIFCHKHKNQAPANF
uniref:Endonuclease n=1 Tax=Pithovirus LCPAC404 TaxID=2506597 RepID=A0A481ZHE8_9VIRU|nr:MAG: endonuclease [Pithovirus LCPAC404]